MSIYQLAYLSFSAEDYDPDGPRGIKSILQAASKYNTEHEISGMLICRDKAFMQLLEGSETEVLNLYGRIAADMRHESIKTLFKSTATSRLFEDWTMAHHNVEAEDCKRFDEILPWGRTLVNSINRKLVEKSQIMRTFEEFRSDCLNQVK